MIGDVPNAQSLMSFPCYTLNIYIHEKAFEKKITSGEVEKKGPIFGAQHFFSPAAENVARPKSRVCAARNQPRGGCCAKRLLCPICCARATALQLIDALLDANYQIIPCYGWITML